MATLAILFTFLTALLHGYFWMLEMFLWTKPMGLKTFHMNLEKAQSSEILAANQGLYNAMLALGLLLSLLIPKAESALAIRLYCLGFIIIVGGYGSYSLKSLKIFFTQAFPATIALFFNALAFLGR